MLIQQSEIMSSTNFNCWRSSIHQSPVYSNRGKCNLSLPTRNDALIGLLGSFYIFNISYNRSNAMLTFLEQALLEIGHRQTLATVSSVFNDLANA